MASRGETDYRQGIRSSVRGLWTGVLDRTQFVDAMVPAIERGFTRAWNEGAESCGVSEDELTLDERIALNDAINEELGFIGNFADAIIDNSKANGGKLTPLFSRINTWVKRFNGVRQRAKMMACGDQKLKWIVNSKETCVDCMKLKNQVRRASVWREKDIHPQHPALECMESAGGVPVCLCDFEETNEPVSRGPVPKI